VAVPLASHKAIFLEDYGALPTPDALQGIRWEREADEFNTRYARLRIEPVPQNFCGIRVILIQGDDWAPPLIHGARSAIRLATMLLKGMFYPYTAH
jgi:hypothetical protein